MPKLSVIVPTYNSGDYLSRCIDSLLAQTFNDFEIIIIDDVSTDGSAAPYREHPDPRIIFHKQAINGGVSLARNAGIERATSDFLMFFDADDIALPNLFVTQYNILKTFPEIGCVGCWVKRIDAAGNLKSQLPAFYNTSNIHGSIKYFLPFMISGSIIRRSIIDRHDIRFRKECRAAEDHDFFARISEHTQIIVFPYVNVYYRDYPVSHTKKNPGPLNAYGTAVRLMNERRINQQPENADVLFEQCQKLSSLKAYEILNYFTKLFFDEGYYQNACLHARLSLGKRLSFVSIYYFVLSVFLCTAKTSGSFKTTLLHLLDRPMLTAMELNGFPQGVFFNHSLTRLIQKEYDSN